MNGKTLADETILIGPVHTTVAARLVRCDRCERELLASTAYHVSSADREGILLDMTVCHPCRVAARALGLKPAKSTSMSTGEHLFGSAGNE